MTQPLAALVEETVAAVGVLLAIDAAGVQFEVVADGGGSNAWTVDGEDGPTSYLALDRLPRTRALRRGLIAHEATHALHRRVRPGAWPATVATKLWDESLAMLVSRALAPGLSDAEIAAFGDADDAWLDECDERWREIHDALSDEDRYAELFARPELRPAGATLPPRCGYAAALRMAAHLVSRHDPRELVRSDALRATALVHETLEELA